MADYVVKGESLTAVADAIREKTGETDVMGLVEMPGKVGAVFEAGKKAENDAFWADFLAPPASWATFAQRFSGRGWSDKTFKPPIGTVISVSNANAANANSMFNYCSITDLKAICEERNVTIDFSAATSFMNTFTDSQITAVPAIDTRGAAALTHIFYNAVFLQTVETLVLRDDGSQTFSNYTFMGCSRLENIVIQGVIGQNGFNVSACTKLTHDSLMSILNALKDYSGSGETYTVTLGAENLAKLSDAEKMQAVSKGWTLVGWTPPTWNEGDWCNACGTATLDAYGRCPACGYSVPKEKRICSCGGEVGEDCVCISCGKTYHASEGPICLFCGLDMTEE